MRNPPIIIGGQPFSVLIPFGSIRDVDPGTVLEYSFFMREANSTSVPAPLSTFPWISFDSDTRRLQGTAPSNGSYYVLVVATDPSDSSANDSFVMNINTPPVVASVPPSATAVVGIPFAVTIPSTTFRTFNGDPLIMTPREQSNSPLASWFSWTFNPVAETLQFTGVALVKDIGSHTFRIYGGNALSPQAAFVLMTVSVVGNRPPIVQNVGFGIGNPRFNVTQSFAVSYASRFLDEDVIGRGDRLAITAGPVGFPDFASLPWIHHDPVAQTISGTAFSNSTGVFPIRITAMDLANQSVSIAFTLTVSPLNSSSYFNSTTNLTVVVPGLPPVARGEVTLQVTQDVPFSHQLFPFLLFSDPEDRSMVFLLRRRGSLGLPPWVSFTPGFSVVGTARNAEVGTWLFSLIAFNSLGFSTAMNLTIVVQNIVGACCGGCGACAFANRAHGCAMLCCACVAVFRSATASKQLRDSVQRHGDGPPGRDLASWSTVC